MIIKQSNLVSRAFELRHVQRSGRPLDRMAKKIFEVGLDLKTAQKLWRQPELRQYIVRAAHENLATA